MGSVVPQTQRRLADLICRADNPSSASRQPLAAALASWLKRRGNAWARAEGCHCHQRALHGMRPTPCSLETGESTGGRPPAPGWGSRVSPAPLGHSWAGPGSQEDIPEPQLRCVMATWGAGAGSRGVFSSHCVSLPEGGGDPRMLLSPYVGLRTSGCRSVAPPREGNLKPHK